MSAIAIELTFAVVWASFGVLHLYRTDDICRNEGETPAAHRLDRNVGFAVGLLAGATVTSITGVGVDMILYTVMVLLMRADLKVAIPTTVIVMALASLAGIVTESLSVGVQPGVYENWLAAAPVVALGAPLGALIVNRVGRRSTLHIVAFLCIAQFLWTLGEFLPELGSLGLAAALIAVIVFNLALEVLWRVGDRLGRRSFHAARLGTIS